MKRYRIREYEMNGERLFQVEERALFGWRYAKHPGGRIGESSDDCVPVDLSLEAARRTIEWLKRPKPKETFIALHEVEESPSTGGGHPTDGEILSAMRTHLDEADGGYAAGTAPAHVIAAGRAVLELASTNKEQ